MIEKLQILNNNMVWGFFGDYAHRRGVFVRRIDGMVPYLTGKPSFLFATEGEAIILCLDLLEKPADELADEEPFGKKNPLYFTSRDSRVSPVYLLSQSLSLLRQTFDYAGLEVPCLQGVLLTNSHFINFDNMVETWQNMGVRVFHQMPKHCLRPYDIEACETTAEPGWFSQYRTNCFDVRSSRLFKEDVFEDDGDDDTNDDDEDDDFSRALKNALDEYNNADDIDEEEDNEIMNNYHPSSTGEFFLSNNNKVKVEILQPITNPREELNRLVGCNDIRRQIDALISLNRYNHLMQRVNPTGRQHKVSLHSIFFGRPGTGKTTVCKIYGSLLHEAGMLSRGHVVCCNRSTFMGNNWGDEDKAVRAVLELAKGGVLMIDEAYLLNSNHPNDPGKLVIPLLMDILANEDRRDLAVILCGYKDEMLRLIDINPGLDSRFPNRFEFPDFTVDDLLEITRRRIREYDYSFTRSAWQKYRQFIAQAYKERDLKTWGNARFVANQLERIYLRHAQRCLRLSSPQRRQLLSITTADIEPFSAPRPNRKIGF